jgi:hypothetical protein
MVLIIFGTVITALGAYLGNKNFNYRLEYLNILGFIISVLFGVLTLFLIVGGACQGYEYNSFVVQRDAFETTLLISRAEGRALESATMSVEVSVWNKKLALFKYKNTLFFIKDMVDDRFNSLKNIQ